MTTTYFTSKGAPVKLGREIGRGGEGSVFDVASAPEQVAKLYLENKLPDASKQAKLSYMASSDRSLVSHVAWPLDTLHRSRGSGPVGFLMPKVLGKAAVHMVYSPAHRRQDYPKAAWDFLVHVARNIAAAFETVHAHGHVVGDVNENSVMVGKDSTVTLIDSDSFQISANGTRYLCEVGVAIYTPPELQSLSTFKGFTRTANHDNFGLALMLFHVLFGGRHPYSGVAQRTGVGEALEEDIKHYRYAYARDNSARGTSPPPRSIPVSILPPAMEAMFEAAFTERGANGGRPTAQQWVAAFDGLFKRLKKCSVSKMHVYPDHVSTCPWCALDKVGLRYFVDLGATYVPTSSGFVLAHAWALIEAVPAPVGVSVPSPHSFKVKAKPLPSSIPGKGTVWSLRALVMVVAGFFMAAVPAIWFFTGLFGIVLCALAGTAGKTARTAERYQRQASLTSARDNLERLVEQAKHEAGPESFLAKRFDLTKLRDEHQALPQVEKRELDNLHSSAQARQLERFLETCHIDSASIPGVGPSRKVALRSFHIETAADVKKDRVQQVRGFGESLTRAVMDWRASCVRRFVFNPALAVSQADKNAVMAKFGSRKLAIEHALTIGVSQLQLIHQDVTARHANMMLQLDAAAERVAQAEADLAVL